MHKIKIEKFEGPLDLLLQLIERQEMDITQVSLAEVTDQYIETLHQSTNIRPGELADFLVVASKLLFIKSKVLLPDLNLGEEEMSDLEYQLKLYKEYQEASMVIHGMILKKKFSFAREKSLVEAPMFNPPPRLTATQMTLTFKNILNDLRVFVPLPKSVIKKAVSIHEKIGQIKKFIYERANLSFKTLLANAKNKTEMIVSFLALLELVKQRAVVVDQGQLFDDIIINPPVGQADKNMDCAN